MRRSPPVRFDREAAMESLPVAVVVWAQGPGVA